MNFCICLYYIGKIPEWQSDLNLFFLFQNTKQPAH